MPRSLSSQQHSWACVLGWRKPRSLSSRQHRWACAPEWRMPRSLSIRQHRWACAPDGRMSRSLSSRQNRWACALGWICRTRCLVGSTVERALQIEECRGAAQTLVLLNQLFLQIRKQRYSYGKFILWDRQFDSVNVLWRQVSRMGRTVLCWNISYWL